MKLSKKIAAILVTAMMVIAMAATAFADDSRTVTVDIVDGNGQGVEVTDTTDDRFEGLTEETAAALPDVIESAGQLEVILDGRHTNIPSSYADQPITFKNVGDAGQKVYAFRWNGENWEYVDVGTVAADGSVTFTFADPSSIGLVLVNDSADGGNTDNKTDEKTAPNTGVSDFVIPAAVLLVLALAGAAYVIKRERA